MCALFLVAARRAALSKGFSSLALSLAFGAGATAQAGERSSVPVKYTWDLSQVYASEADFLAAKDKLQKQLADLTSFRGHLGDSADKLWRSLRLRDDLDKELARLATYASQLYDQDTRVGRSQELQQGVEQVAVEFHATSAFIAPELLAIDEAKLRGWMAKDERFKEFKVLIEDTLRQRAHTLTQAEERIAAEAGNMAGAGHSIYSTFTNADLPYPEVKLSDGTKVRLDAAAYTKWRAAKNRADRELVFREFWSTYQKFTRTLGTSLYAQVMSHIFEKKIRGFNSSLEAALFGDNIPPAVYTQLIADVRRSLPTLHRYLKLRQRMLGLKELRYDDLYAPLVGDVDLKYTPEQGMDLTLAAVAPLGPDYVNALKKGFASRWVDFLPSTGKRSGAYSNGDAYDVHPYQLLNFMGRYEDVSTLAHESGHSMHSYLANKAQPFSTHGYSIFVAEVASTLNENLLLHDMLAKSADDGTRLYLLGSYLEGLRLTLYRQTMFAEFELRMHEMVERGETLTGENLSALYLKLLREYYGHDQGVCIIDDLYGAEWAYIPHFYYNFYVFKYATSLVASLSITKSIREEAAAVKPSTKTRDAYLKMLAAGSSEYPMDLLKGVGVDMSTSAPFEAAMLEMNRIMDEMEAVLAKKTAGKAK